MDVTTEHGRNAVAADLIAVLVAVTGAQPRVLTVEHSAGANPPTLPAGPFELRHRSLQAGLRAWVEQQTHHPLGYVEQLYTFADRDRVRDGGGHGISISYLGLTREARRPGWRNWYDFFPWEDHRAGPHPSLAATILPALENWVSIPGPAQDRRRQRVAISFGAVGRWNEEFILQRYELLFEAGLIAESGAAPQAAFGQPMVSDHRRILATAIARLRGKIKYRPVVFELMPPAFTLLQLQRSVEAIAGRTLHKQNFRRLIETQQLVEETGEIAQDTGGRPARLVRFRGDVLAERAVIGSKLPLSRA
jgi:hypothetical protein